MKSPAPRYEIELLVRLFPFGSDDSFAGVSKNLSETGVLISAERAQLTGAIVRLKFAEFDWTTQVVWTRDTERVVGVLLGMKFMELSEDDRKLLIRLIKRAADSLRVPRHGAGTSKPP